ncbi:MAG: hypothetical protein WBD62_15070, partial [Anaerolineales bacterium]
DEEIAMNDDFDLAMPILLVTMCGIALTLTKIAIQIESENSSSLVIFRKGFTPIVAYSDLDNPPSCRCMMPTSRFSNSPPMNSIHRETHHVLIF